MGSSEDNASDGSAQGLIEVGLRHHHAGELKEAERAYRRAMAVEPGNSDAPHLLGLIAHQRGDHAKAIGLITQAIAADGTCASYHNNLGEAYRCLGQLDQAEKAYGEAIRLQGDFPEPHNNLGMVLQKRERFDAAIELYRRAIELQPDFAEAYNNLGTAWVAKGRFSKGIPAYEKAIQLKSDYADAYSNLGFALGSQGETAQAIEWCLRAIEIDPDHYQGHRNLAGLYEKAGQSDKAIEAYRQALRCRPDEQETRYYLACLSGADAPACAPSSYVKALFDHYAPTFDAHLTGGLHYRAPQLIHDAIAATSPRGKLDILDLGCGTGLGGLVLRRFAARLVGVDLSAGMIEKARQRKIYSELIVDDLTAAMGRLGRRFDLVTAADVFVYLGDLAAAFQGAAEVLRPGGMLVFSVEVDEGTRSYVLRQTRRYAHSLEYIRGLAKDNGFGEVSIRREVLRTEHGQAVEGWIVVLRAGGVDRLR
jgi:predicted TPR repeat methyltransferase